MAFSKKKEFFLESCSKISIPIKELEQQTKELKPISVVFSSEESLQLERIVTDVFNELRRKDCVLLEFIPRPVLEQKGKYYYSRVMTFLDQQEFFSVLHSFSLPKSVFIKIEE